MHVEYTAVKLRGSKYKGRRIEEVKPGVELELQREPQNVHDSNAVLVLGTVGQYESVPLGYLPRGVASKVGPQMDAGREFHVVYVGGAEDFAPYLMILTPGDGDELKLTKLKHR